jgi:divalent metal cation (Fe/Co/Zn/Cd) transporter
MRIGTIHSMRPKPRTASTLAPAGLLLRGLRLEYATLCWNIVGSIVVVAAAIGARSVALAGFGLDSLIEIFASLVVVWELKGICRQGERRALRLIGAAFFVPAVYVLLQAVYTLVGGAHPHHSPVGIAWLAATFVAMLLLAWGKGHTGKALGNAVLLTESRVTLVDAYLAGAVLVGLLLNAAVGWWWADPLAGLVIVYYGLREGWAAWHGEE